MAEKKVLRRLLRLRELEEELSRTELEAAVGDRNRIARDLSAAIERMDRGRESFIAGLGDPAPAAWSGGVIAMEQARRQRARIEPRLAAADTEVTRQRQEFLGRRTARRQVETLVDREQAALEEEAARRAQQMLDDWFGRRSPRNRERTTADSGAENPVVERSEDDSFSRPAVDISDCFNQ